MDYSKKLKDPRWQRRRLEIFERDKWTCQSCGRTDNSLHIHHLKYLPGLDPWDYEAHYLITYCETCHETEHLIGDQVRGILYEMIDANKIFIKPLSQINILIEDYQPFYKMLKEFLTECMIQHLKSKTMKTA
jgi:hypothetical protein